MSKSSTQLSYIVHLLATIQIVREITERTGQNSRPLLSSAALAKSLHTHPAYIRKLMRIAARGNLLVSEKGKAEPRLALPAAEITLLAIYQVVEGVKNVLNLNIHINPECNVAKAIQYSLGDEYARVQKAAEEEMANITLQDIIEGYYTRMGNDRLPD